MTDESAEDGSKYPAFLLDYLYVDVARIRSYLAQLAGGVPTTASEALEHARSRTVEASVPVAKGRGSSVTSERWETTRSLGDLIVPAFEEEATAAGYLIDVSGDMCDPDDWYSGQVHRRLPVGSILRNTGPTRLLDPLHVHERIEQFEGAASALDRMRSGSGGSQPKKGSRVTPKGGAPAKPAPLGAIKKTTEPIRQLVKSLLAGGISLRAFPCGLDHPDCAFGGLLLDRSDYVEPERGALFARHGVTVSDWTVVAVVSRLPKRTQRLDLDPIDESAMVRPSGGINRSGLEGAVVQLLEMMEGFGMREGPTWPSVGVTPLAVYRTMTKAP